LMAAAPKHLRHYEQQVNDRFMTSQPPAIDKRLLPENASRIPLAWRKTPINDIEVFSSTRGAIEPLLPFLADDGSVMMPVHPLSEYRYQADELTRSGHIQFSASYRTVFFEPEAGGVLQDWTPSGQTLMIKLGLDEPLPGIPGDRRLTRDKIEKCILLSDALPAELEDDPLAARLDIVPEFFGLSCPDHGVIFRLLPETGVMPLFSLFSVDRTSPNEPPIIVSRLQSMYQGDAREIAQNLGSQLAKPLIESLLAGFRAGFSLEMHAQNTLISLGENSLIDRVFFRDLEGVVFSNKFRVERGLQPLFADIDNDELVWDGNSMRSWFNRNLDHDLGRVFEGALTVLVARGVLDGKEKSVAIASIQKVIREAIRAAGLENIAWPGRVLPFSRAPWGNGLRPGHYFATRFR
jgi:hypothetical protein